MRPQPERVGLLELYAQRPGELLSIVPKNSVRQRRPLVIHRGSRLFRYSIPARQTKRVLPAAGNFHRLWQRNCHKPIVRELPHVEGRSCQNSAVLVHQLNKQFTPVLPPIGARLKCQGINAASGQAKALLQYMSPAQRLRPGCALWNGERLSVPPKKLFARNAVQRGGQQAVQQKNTGTALRKGDPLHD